MALSKKLTAEFIGTFWLVLGGCGSAVLAAGYPGVGIGWLGVSLAFGLTVLTMAYAIDPVQRCPDTTLARNTLAWKPQTTLNDGLRHTISYFEGLLSGTHV